MDDQEKTVFVSYRRSASRYAARAIFQHLRHEGFDVFMDVESIDSGDFERIILNQIAARAHFIVILSKGTVERLSNPGDWLRKEITHALDLQRNVVPVLLSDFRFEDAEPFLTGQLALLKRLNALTVPDEYFEEAMNRLCTRFLKQPVYGEITPPPISEQKEVQRKIRRAIEDTETKYSSEIQHNLSESDHNLMISLVQELKQPISSVIGYCDLLLGESVGILGNLQSKNLKQSKDAIERISVVVDLLLNSIETSNFEKASLHVQEVQSLVNVLNENTENLLTEKIGILGALQRKFVERIIASLERMKSLLNDLGKIL